MEQDSYRGIADFYDRLFESTNRGLSLAGIRMCHPQKGARVLDVCCGTGSQLALYQRYQCRLSGLDASPAMLGVARRRLGAAAQLNLGDATRMPYADRRFDLVSCKLALHEMPPGMRAAVLGETKRVLKSDGRILLIDFRPGPYQPLKGWISRAVSFVAEFAAGGEHFKNQRQFLAAGGLPMLAQQQDLRIEKQHVMAGGTFAVLCLVRA